MLTIPKTPETNMNIVGAISVIVADPNFIAISYIPIIADNDMPVNTQNSTKYNM